MLIGARKSEVEIAIIEISDKILLKDTVPSLTH